MLPITRIQTIQELPKAQPIQQIASTTVQATVTAYSSEESQTDDTPFITANGETVHVGGIACPAHLPFGTKIIISGTTYTCNDRMASRYRNLHYYDIWLASTSEAVQFGRKTLQVTILK